MRISPSSMWRRRGSFYRLEAGRCTDCGNITFPPQPLCPKCGSQKLEMLRLSGRGKVLSYTVSYQTREGYEKESPQVFALIELQEGLRLVAPLTDTEEGGVKEGTEVEAVIRRVRTDSVNGLIQYMIKFRPI